MSPFSIIVTLLLIFTSALVFVLAAIIKKNKVILSKEEDKNTKLQDEIESYYIKAEDEKHDLLTNISQLKNDTQKLKEDTENAVEEGRKEVLSEIDDIQAQLVDSQAIIEQYEKDLNEATKNAEKFQKKLGNFDLDRHKILLEELNDNINWGQSQILNYLDNNLDVKDISFSLTKENNFTLSFDDAIAKTGLQQEKHFLSEKFKVSDEDGDEKTLYVILFSANGNIVLIDGKFSAFIEQNIQYLDSKSPQIQDQIRNIIQERANFLANPEFIKTLKQTLEELENVRSISTIQTCIYIPSELAVEKLVNNLGDFNSLVPTQEITPLSPSGFINVLQSCKFLYEIEQGVIKYQILADIITDFNMTLPSYDAEETPEDIPSEEVEQEDTIDLENNKNIPNIDDKSAPKMLDDIGLDDLDINDITADKSDVYVSPEISDDDIGLNELDLDDLNLDEVKSEEEANSDSETDNSEINLEDTEDNIQKSEDETTSDNNIEINLDDNPDDIDNIDLDNLDKSQNETDSNIDQNNEDAVNIDENIEADNLIQDAETSDDIDDIDLDNLDDTEDRDDTDDADDTDIDNPEENADDAESDQNDANELEPVAVSENIADDTEKAAPKADPDIDIDELLSDQNDDDLDISDLITETTDDTESADSKSEEDVTAKTDTEEDNVADNADETKEDADTDTSSEGDNSDAAFEEFDVDGLFEEEEKKDKS